MSENRAAIRQMLVAGALLLSFTLAGVGMVALTYERTLERVEDNRRMTLLRQLQDVVPAERYDNQPDQDTMEASDPPLLGSNRPMTVYRARQEDEPVAAIITTMAPDGYSGEIALLVGVYTDGTLAGVRVVAHRETPGLGDAIERRRSNWIKQFDGRSLEDPAVEDWQVRRDGGAFDGISGATITARAVIQSVHNALLFFHRNEELLFAEADTLAQARAAAEEAEREEDDEAPEQPPEEPAPAEEEPPGDEDLEEPEEPDDGE